MSDDKEIFDETEVVEGEFALDQLDFSAEDLQKADEAFRVFLFIQGLDWEQKPFWAYMAISPSRVQEFQEERSKGNNALFDYGDVLNFGYGIEPSQEVKEFMEENYGIKHDFEDQVEQAAKQMTERKEVLDKYTQTKQKDKNEQ